MLAEKKAKRIKVELKKVKKPAQLERKRIASSGTNNNNVRSNSFDYHFVSCVNTRQKSDEKRYDISDKDLRIILDRRTDRSRAYRERKRRRYETSNENNNNNNNVRSNSFDYNFVSCVNTKSDKKRYDISSEEGEIRSKEKYTM
jgi:hypothetical protein